MTVHSGTEREDNKTHGLLARHSRLPKEGGKQVSNRVLIAEPDVDLLDVFARYLSQMGFDVATAATGGDCLRQVGAFRPNVLLLEPVGWGTDLLARIAEEWHTHRVVLLSIRDELDPRAFRQLVKPVQLSELRDVIRDAAGLQSEVKRAP